LIFPELASRIKGFLSARERASGPVSLDLKSYTAYSGLTPADWYQREGYYGLAAALSLGSPTWSGDRVNLNSALNHSVVWQCNRVISEPVGFLPLSMMQGTATGKRVASEHPMHAAVHDEPNAEMSAMSFRETLTSHALLQGNGYAQIIRRSGTGVAIELRVLQPSQVLVNRETSGQRRLVYVVKDPNSPDTTYTVERGKPQDIFHLKGIGNNGIKGYSVLEMARQSIGTGLAGERTVGRYFAAGGRVPYVLSLAKDFKTDSDFDRFRADWEKTYSEPHRAPMLPPGITYQQVGLSHVDAQMLEQRQFTIPEICRWFNVSPHLAGDLSHATFSNVEQLALDHVKFCLNAWFKRWQGELRRCVLTPDEKAQGYYFKFNLNAILEGDFVSRMAGYASALQNGEVTIDEVRNLEDRDPLPNGTGTAAHIQMNMQSLPVVRPPEPGTATPDPAAAHLSAADKQGSKS
jgi:HK97 family phage portal protein